jgi:hypothetical protein
VQDRGRHAGERLGHAGRDESRTRLEVAHLGLERLDLVRLDVRRVRDDEVERALEAGEEVALDELDAIAKTRVGPVLGRDLERAL